MINKKACFMIGISGLVLTNEEIKQLNNSLTAGVILFSRNYEGISQLKKLVKSIRNNSKNQLLIAVDNEGGKVQRFIKDFTHLPAMSEVGKAYDNDKNLGLELAYSCGIIMAYELAQCDIDFSFAPVLDINNKNSKVIFGRGFHLEPMVITKLANQFQKAVKLLGMACVGKHFPGHGSVIADSHFELPKYTKTLEQLKAKDLIPFENLIKNNIEAIMPSHILYTAIDGIPAGFSNFWLKDILRTQLNFKGAIISDDLDMAGAAFMGDITTRLKFALHNCDLVLLCNNKEHIKTAFETIYPIIDPERQLRLSKLKLKKINLDEVKPQYLKAKNILNSRFNIK